MKRTLIFALEGESQAQEKLTALKADGRMAGRRNAELWEGFVEPARAVIIFPNPHADAIAAAYNAAGIAVEVINGNEKERQKDVGGGSESVKADEGQNDQTEKRRKGQVK